MSETLLSLSEVLLFGRVMEDMEFKYKKPSGSHQSPRLDPKNGLNSELVDQLSVDKAKLEDAGPRFARIYGFSYEGAYYDLDAPTIMLVHGPGVKVDDDSVDGGGEATTDREFADDVMAWSYDKGDFSVRLESVTGSIEDILLDMEIGTGVGAISGGRVSGGRVSGGRVSGGRVSGGRVSGGRVSGGRVSGGRVSGDD